MNNTVCFTGHRPNHIPFSLSNSIEGENLKNKLTETIIQLIENGYTNFICGMAIGIDLLCADIVLNLKNNYDIKLNCYLPCHNQDRLWNKKDKMHYSNILKQADNVIYAVDSDYCTGCTQLRNKMMVNDSDIIIAVYYGINGGTKHTIDYANSLDKQIIYIK